MELKFCDTYKTVPIFCQISPISETIIIFTQTENLMKTKQPELNKITALYERLSRDDEQSGDTKHRRL